MRRGEEAAGEGKEEGAGEGAAPAGMTCQGTGLPS